MWKDISYLISVAFYVAQEEVEVVICDWAHGTVWATIQDIQFAIDKLERMEYSLSPTKFMWFKGNPSRVVIANPPFMSWDRVTVTLQDLIRIKDLYWFHHGELLTK